MRLRLAVVSAFLVSACGSKDAATPAAGGGAAGSTGGSGPTSAGAPTTSGGSPATSAGGSTSLPSLAGGGVGAPSFAAGDLDPPSDGATITFQNIGAPGWYPTRRDPAVGPCDVSSTDQCCLGKDEITSDALTPWDADLVMTLRGPMTVKQLAVYQPEADGSWGLTSSWDDRAASAPAGLAFDGNGTDAAGFPGGVGTECLVNVASAAPFPCGPGSDPFCPASTSGAAAHLGWSGSKLFVLLARMSHASEPNAPAACSKDATGNWYDAPWIGLSLGELVRAGSFSSCQCYAKDPTQWWLGDGCGQFNAFEVVNDNNSSRNFDVFSTSLFGYAGYVGDGPCGANCDVTKLSAATDLVRTKDDVESPAGALAAPGMGPGAAFRRPENGYRYFLLLLDVPSRTIQLALVHPQAVPAAIAPLLPALPASVPPAAIAGLLDLRLPR